MNAVLVLPLALILVLVDASKPPTHSPCLCVFDIDRTLTGKQDDTQGCPRNRIIDGVRDRAYGGGNATLSALSNEGIGSTFCGDCYLGITSAGGGSGENSSWNKYLLDTVMRGAVHDAFTQKFADSQRWSYGTAVRSPYVLRQPNRRKQEVVELIRQWYGKHDVDIHPSDIYFFGDLTENIMPFREKGMNSREISCASRERRRVGTIGHCGATPGEIQKVRGNFLCNQLPEVNGRYCHLTRDEYRPYKTAPNASLSYFPPIIKQPVGYLPVTRINGSTPQGFRFHYYAKGCSDLHIKASKAMVANNRADLIYKMLAQKMIPTNKSFEELVEFHCAAKMTRAMNVTNFSAAMVLQKLRDASPYNLPVHPSILKVSVGCLNSLILRTMRAVGLDTVVLNFEIPGGNPGFVFRKGRKINTHKIEIIHNGAQYYDAAYVPCNITASPCFHCGSVATPLAAQACNEFHES